MPTRTMSFLLPRTAVLAALAVVSVLAGAAAPVAAAPAATPLAVFLSDTTLPDTLPVDEVPDSLPPDTGEVDMPTVPGGAPEVEAGPPAAAPGAPDEDPSEENGGIVGMTSEVCTRIETLQRYATTVQQLASQLPSVMSSLPSPSIRGAPLSDLGLQAATRAVAFANGRSNTHEMQTAAAAIAMACNAAQSARYAEHTNVFYREVVNAGIRLTLPELSGVVRAAFLNDPRLLAREATQVLRMQRLFAARATPEQGRQDPGSVVSDSVTARAMTQAVKSRTVADSTAQLLDGLERELRGLPVSSRGVWMCAAFADSVNGTQPAYAAPDSVSLCAGGPASPMRAKQIEAAAAAIAAAAQADANRSTSTALELKVTEAARRETHRKMRVQGYLLRGRS